MSLAGGRNGQLGQPARENQAHFGEGDGPDRTHGSKLGEQREDARRVSQSAGGECAERVQPRGPGRARRKRRERVEQRQREVAQRSEVGHLALDALGLRLVFGEGRESGSKLRLETVQPPLPAAPAADHRRLDQELLPAPRSSQGARHDRCVQVYRPPGIVRGSGILRQGRSELRIRRHPAVTGRRRLRWRAGDGLRNLAEAQVLGEPARGETVGGAGKQREKGASRGIGLLRSRGEVRGDSGTHKRLLQQRTILERRPEQHRHPVERNASLRLAAHQAGDLDAFAAFSRRGKEHYVVARRRNGRRPFDEQPLLHSSQRGVRLFPERARRDVESVRDSRRVRCRGDGQDRSAESGDEALFERSAQWKIDQQRRQIQQRRLRFQREPEDRGAVGQGCPSQLGFVCVEDPPEISARSRPREAQLLDRPRKRPGQARLRSDGIEFPQPAAELMDDSRTHGLHAERRQRREAAPGHGLRSNDSGQAPQREPLPAESRPRIGGRGADDLCRRLLRAGDDEGTSRRAALPQPRARQIEPGGGRRGCDQLPHIAQPTLWVRHSPPTSVLRE